MEKNELLKQFEEEFAKVKKDLGFKASLEELDGVFFLRDFILKEGFVPTTLSRSICGRMMETYFSWTNYLHSLLMPNPGYMISMSESQMFNDHEKEEVFKIISKVMVLINRNSIIGLTKNKADEGKFIDDCLFFWNKTFKLEIEKIVKKIKDSWEEKSKP
ncbi:MAG: hypothetical protein HYS32_00790 [Candidatus Woesearchaeota archaeon]|nr:MAG: hypothetical protein HYS32_00790 [Candidatus Woesearchaeota archaeon]